MVDGEQMACQIQLRDPDDSGAGFNLCHSYLRDVFMFQVWLDSKENS